VRARPGNRHPAGNPSNVIPRRLFGLATAWALWLIPHAAVAEYRFDVWTTDSGLPQNSISTILQSRDGYLWLSTLDGLVRFDGVRAAPWLPPESARLPSGLR